METYVNTLDSVPRFSLMTTKYFKMFCFMKFTYYMFTYGFQTPSPYVPPLMSDAKFCTHTGPWAKL
jgi:hypothetical protein